MLKQERRFWEWIEKHMLLWTMLAVSVIAALIRYSFREKLTSDISACLLPWYEMIKENGGIYALGSQVGDYNIPYQFLIALFTYLPISPINAYKLLSCIFDYLLAGCIGFLVYTISDSDRLLRGITAYSAVLFSPLVFFNSSYWGQCDAIYAFFCVASLAAFLNDKYKWTFILFGIAFAFKLQAVFLLPFYLFAYFRKKTFSVFYFGLIPFMMIFLSIPGIIMGRKVSEVFTIYFYQAEAYGTIAMNYPTFWNLFQDTFLAQFYLDMKKPAIAVTVVLLGFLMVWWTYKKTCFTSRNMIYMAFLITYTCVLFLPSMHERYGYLYEILAIVVAFLEMKTLPLIIAMYIVDFAIYGHYLFSYTINTTLLSEINVIVYIGYLFVLGYPMLKQMGEVYEQKQAL